MNKTEVKKTKETDNISPQFIKQFLKKTDTLTDQGDAIIKRINYIVNFIYKSFGQLDNFEGWDFTYIYQDAYLDPPDHDEIYLDQCIEAMRRSIKDNHITLTIDVSFTNNEITNYSTFNGKKYIWSDETIKIPVSWLHLNFEPEFLKTFVKDYKGKIKASAHNESIKKIKRI